jgi:hypothetical protein
MLRTDLLYIERGCGPDLHDLLPFPTAGNFGNVGKTFGDFNCSFTSSAVGLSCDKFTARDLFRGVSLGTYTGGMWKEVDESSISCIILVAQDCPTHDQI